MAYTTERVAKFVYRGIGRQLKVQEKNQTIPWNDLVTQVRQAHRIPADRQFTVTYEDADDDIIEVDTDEELKWAVSHLLSNTGKLRFTVRDDIEAGRAPAPSTAPSINQDGTLQMQDLPQDSPVASPLERSHSDEFVVIDNDAQEESAAPDTAPPSMADSTVFDYNDVSTGVDFTQTSEKGKEPASSVSENGPASNVHVSPTPPSADGVKVDAFEGYGDYLNDLPEFCEDYPDSANGSSTSKNQTDSASSKQDKGDKKDSDSDTPDQIQQDVPNPFDLLAQAFGPILQQVAQQVTQLANNEQLASQVKDYATRMGCESREEMNRVGEDIRKACAEFQEYFPRASGSAPASGENESSSSDHENRCGGNGSRRRHGRCHNRAGRRSHHYGPQAQGPTPFMFPPHGFSGTFPFSLFSGFASQPPFPQHPAPPSAHEPAADASPSAHERKEKSEPPIGQEKEKKDHVHAHAEDHQASGSGSPHASASAHAFAHRHSHGHPSRPAFGMPQMHAFGPAHQHPHGLHHRHAHGHPRGPMHQPPHVPPPPPTETTPTGHTEPSTFPGTFPGTAWPNFFGAFGGSGQPTSLSEDSLIQLQAMGFWNRARNEQLLREHKGKLETVIEILLREGPAHM
ncbi:hypothetical protein DFS34DRAFT_186497 [Phlyctochytrium arcticum]|nr:hypothetical protein DFS34DRAFT_186497 [Phlyctochytrium arcticum]